ncbi:MAG: sensor histidine kinase [Lachnospiraceae bacterium]|nr:sensor histidine kinase [Lachnospiraceae bacterium]
MSGKQYLRNKLPVILINLLGMLALALFLSAGGVGIQTILFIGVIWVLTAVCYLIVVFLSRKKYLDRLLDMTEQLEEKYLITEVMTVPERAGEQVYYRIMKMGEKSMLEKIGRIEKERKEYKEYIEQWIHEAKTPITAMKLICENNRCDFTGELLIELENMNRYTEQALYYARSEHTEKDYLIRETDLEAVVHGAIADNKHLLRQNSVAITVDDIQEHVYTDEKWVHFILDQIIGNAVKYRTEQPALHFYAVKKGDWIELSVEDNGIGIPEGDLPRIFDKGFTGQNGRTVQGSTGIGLYLCKRLCDKLGIGLSAYSEGEGAVIVLSFHINDFVAEVQG